MGRFVSTVSLSVVICALQLTKWPVLRDEQREASATVKTVRMRHTCGGNSCLGRAQNKTHIKIQSKCAYLLLGQGTGELISREAVHDQLTIQRQTNRDSTTTPRPTRAKPRHILNWLKMASGYGMNGGKSVLGSADTTNTIIRAVVG